MIEVKEKSYLKFCLISKGEDYYGGNSKDYERLVVLKRLRDVKGPLKLKVSPYRRHSSDPLCRHKTTNYLFNVMVKKEALAKGFYDAIILNERDEVCETSSANLLFLKGDTLYTPAPECGRLEGTTLRIVKESLQVKEERIKVGDLQSFDAVFVINALMDCLPAKIEGIELKTLEEVAQQIKKIIEGF